MSHLPRSRPIMVQRKLQMWSTCGSNIYCYLVSRCDLVEPERLYSSCGSDCSSSRFLVSKYLCFVVSSDCVHTGLSHKPSMNQCEDRTSI